MIPKLNSSQLKRALKISMQAGRSSVIYGLPGCGKTAIPGQLSQELSLPFLQESASSMDTIDFRGCPAVTDKTRFIPPEFWPDDPAWEGVILIDDVLKGDRDIQKHLAHALNERMVGGMRLPEKAHFILTANRVEDRSGDTAMLGHVNNRVDHYELIPEVDAWIRDFALTHNIHPLCIAFFRAFPALFAEEVRKHGAFCTPRAIEGLSNKLHILQTKIELSDITATIGEPVGVQLHGFLEVYQAIPDIKLIAMNPDAQPVPTELGAQFSVVSAMAYNANEQNYDNFHKFAARMGREFESLLSYDAGERNPRVRTCPKWLEWAVRDGNTVLR